MEKTWQIIDNNGIIHSGNEDDMDVAWDYMTLSLDTLYSLHEGQISKTELQEGINKWKTPWTGDLKLIQIYKTFR